MKAIIFNYNNVLEAQLENGSVIPGDEGESAKDFRARVAGIIEEVELEDAELQPNVTFAKVKKFSATKIASELENAKGLYLEMLTAAQALHDNGSAAVENATTEAETQKAALAAEKQAVKEAAQLEKQKAKEAKAAARQAAKEAKAAEKEAKRVEREKAREEAKAAKEAEKAAKQKAREERLANRPTLEQVLQEKEGLKSMKNNVVTFIPFGAENEERISGVINGVVTDKRVPMNLLRIHVGTGDDKQIFHLRPTNPTLETDNEATAKLLAEIEEARQAKEQAKIDAAQAKADAKAAKEAARAEAKAAKEAEKAEKQKAKEAAKVEDTKAPEGKVEPSANSTVYEFDAEEEGDETEDLF